MVLTHPSYEQLNQLGLFGMAKAHQEIGENAEAAAWFRRYLAERPNDTFGTCRNRCVLSFQFQSPRGSPRGGVESLDRLYCASQH